MTTSELRSDVGVTVADLSAKVREAVLAGNSADAAEWAEALDNATSAYTNLEGDDE